MACSKAIIDEPKDVYLEFSDKAKLFRKFEPSPVERRVFELGRFSDWAPKHLRGKRAYAVFAESIMKPFGKYDDPLFREGARAAIVTLFMTWCGPIGNASWANCVDPGYESGCANEFGPGSNKETYAHCVMGGPSYAPALFAHSSRPTNIGDLNSISAYAKPCPVASSTPDLKDKIKMSDTVKIRCVAGLDTTNSAYYNRYIAVDSSGSSYSFRYFSLGAIGSPVIVIHWTLYDTGATTTKGATDVYYYIYTIGFYFAQ